MSVINPTSAKKGVFHLIVPLILVLLCNCNCGASNKVLTLRYFGAKGDGKTNDTKAFLKALKAAQDMDVVLSGENLTYVITGQQNLALKKMVLKGLTVKIFGSNAQLALNINCNNVSIDQLKIIGSRGQSVENWKVFGKEHHINSIMPSNADVILINATRKDAKINIAHVEAINIHARSCITVITLGDVELSNVSFRNISNKTIHVYHTLDDGKTVGGSTHLKNATAVDVGILPKVILVNGKSYLTSAGLYMPQESFNFIVSFGTYYAYHIKVNNYGSTGLTADRNEYFEADLVNINNSSNQTYSNNSSAALWFEACKKVRVISASLSIDDRGPRDLDFDSSALHIFGNNSSVIIDTLTIKGGKKTVLNKGIRGSLAGENNIKLGNVTVQGNYKNAGIAFGILDTGNKSSINIAHLNLVGNKANFHGINKVEIAAVNGTYKNEEVNFYIDDAGTGTEKLSIGKTNITNFGLSKNIRNFSVGQNLSKTGIDIKRIN
ncbi:hypothetical protein SAMN04488511_10318 [Pedobacter suwonensis]|uniref:Pectate lyase superfamily protein n=1 Tax=Pedobacter suwonensis TaxID=332999 RepID=A0A1I0SRQ8_9SPHI|nr:hypothetical protein [Pedobacter suwonensis]SFA42228.1 hypothetical protein SAMN04488511_10318 [Pedobacter suwonensis]